MIEHNQIQIEATQASLTIYDREGFKVIFERNESGSLEVGVGPSAELYGTTWSEFYPDDAPDALAAIQVWIEGLS